MFADCPLPRDTGAGRASRLKGAVLARAGVLTLVGVLFLAACGGDGDNAADSGGASTTASHGDRIVIRTKMVVAATDGSEPIATGDVLDGSTFGGSGFCAGGTIRDTHADKDPAMKPYLIDRKITCPDGTVRMGLTPLVGDTDEPQGDAQPGSWTIVSGTGSFEGIRGGGTMKTVYGPSEDEPARETLTGTVTR